MSTLLRGWAVLLLMVGLCWPVVVAGAEPEPKPNAVVVVLVPLSGELSTMGEQLVEAARLAARRTGVIIEGIDEGESVEQTLEAVAAQGEREEVVAIIGPLKRRHGEPAARLAQQKGVPMVVYSSQQGVEMRGNKIFRGRPGFDAQAKQLAEYLRTGLEIDDVGVVAPRSRYGDEALPAVVDAMDEQGGRVSAMARYPENTTDFRIPLQVLTGQRAYVGRGRSLSQHRVDRWGTVSLVGENAPDFEALIILDFHDVVARMLPFLPGEGLRTGASEQGRPLQLIGLSGWRGDGLGRAGDHAMGGVFFDTFGGERDGLTAQRFVSEFRGITGREVTTPEAEIYDLVALIATAVERAPSTQRRDAVVEFLRNDSPYVGVTGNWAFDRWGAPIRTLHPYRVIDEGQWVRADGGDW